MTLVKFISQLDSAEPPEKDEHYSSITKLLLDNAEESYSGISNENIVTLYQNILDDLKKEKESPQLVKLLHSLLQSEKLQKFLPEAEKEKIFKDIIGNIDSTQHESVLVNYFSVLIQMPSFPNAEDTVLNDLLRRIDDVLSNRKDPASTYTVCTYFQKFLNDYEERLSSFIPVLSKIVFLPLCHPANKVRDIAVKSLDMFPKILLYSSDETSTSCLLKLLKESYCKDMLHLFKEKQEIYVLKVWTHVVKALGSALSANLSNITPFFQVIEKGFKSPIDDICIASFVAWKSLIDSFSGTEGALNDSKRLRFMLKPFKNISRLNENILSVACDTWMHLAWNLGGHLSARFSEVCIPLLELTVGKISNGLTEKIPQKGGSVTLVKKSCYILLRFLELPPNDSFNRLSSPKKLPHIPYPTLQTPLDIKIITHHFKEILCVVKIIIDTCGSKEDMKSYLDCLMKSVLFIVSTVIEDSNKESTEAVNLFFNFMSDVIDNKIYPSQSCLKCLESLSKLPRKVLVSHSFNCGSRKPQEILCYTLLKMLLSPHLFPSEQPKRFFIAYNRLIQAGVHESFYPLSNAYKFMHVIRSAIGTINVDGDVLIELWSGVAGTLLEVIEKTQEVNQGDKQEHDFTCMYDVLLFPFEFIFPVYIHQFRMRPVTKLWTSLYKTFICSASLVPTTSANEACENFCAKLKCFLKDEFLKKPHFMESFCLFMQSIMESIDFTSGSTSGTQGIVDVANMMKRKKPLGNLTSFVNLLVILLKAYHTHYIEAEEDSTQSSAPAIQRKVHIVKNAAPLDILKTFFGNMKTGSTISLTLEQLVEPLAKLFVKSSQKRNLMSHGDSKLEMLWNVITSSIERYYLGPYDSEFLVLLSPLLEATFSHPKRNIKEKSRRFWFATFGSNASLLKFPDSLKNLLKKMKLPLVPDDICSAEFSVSPMPDSLPEDSCEVVPSPVPLALTKPFKSPVSVNGEVPKVAPKEIKQSPKVAIDDLPSEEFVKIDSPVVSTPKRNVRKRRSYVPTLYNDLSQDTATLLSSSESQDTTNSASLEEIAVKETVVETSPKELSESKHSSSPATSHEESPVAVSKKVKSTIAAKFEDKLNENLSKDQSANDKENISGSPEMNNEIKTSDKLKLEVTNSFSKEKRAQSSTCDKISVFSKPGEKQAVPRSTRRTRLSQSFSVLSAEKISEKIESQKLNKSCVEIILPDSDDIIPSSQGSSETENTIKLSVNNGHQKSQLDDESNLNKSPEHSLSSDECENSVNENTTLVTSTPSKSNLPSLMITDEPCETPNKNLKSNDSKENSDLAKVVEKNNQETVSETVCQSKELEIQVSSKEIITGMGTLLDAVDSLVKTSLEKPDSDSVTHHLQSDIKMKDVSELDVKTKDLCPCDVNILPDTPNIADEIKSSISSSNIPVNPNMSLPESKVVIPVDSDMLEKIPSPYEPIAKRSRLSLKQSEKFSQNETYSQKLRKKNINTESKPQQKSRKKKVLKKDDILSKDVKNKLKDNLQPSMDIENINQSCDFVENKAPDKKEQPSSQSEQLKNFENTELNIKCSPSNICKKDIVSQSSDKCNEIASQAIESAESCEIFEVFSNNSVEVQDIDNTSPELSESSQGSSQSNNDSPNNSQEYQPAKQSETCHLLSSANVEGISEIPCSLENNSVSCVSDELNDKNSKMELCEVKQSEGLDDADKNKMDAQNEVDSNPSAIRFSAIEDDLSSEMHHIVDSVVSMKCKDVDSSANESVSVHKVKSVQNPSIPVSISDKDNLICDNKPDSSVGGEKEKCGVELSSVEQIHNHSSIEDKENISDSAEEYNSNDLIMSSNTQDDLDYSAKILVNSAFTDTSINNQKYANHEEKSITDSTLDAEKSTFQDGNFSPELDHSYSYKQGEDELTDNKLEDDSNSSEEIDVVTVDPSSPYNSSFSNLTTPGHEISCLMRDLVILVERFDAGNYSSSCDKNHESTIKTDLKITSPNSNHASNKENEDLVSKNDNKLAKGSKKRKVKAPIRSPFNFRQRAKLDSTKKVTTKSIKTLNVTHIKSLSDTEDLVIKSLFHKDDLEDEADNSMAKIISSIVDSITVEDDIKTEPIPHIPSSSHIPKTSRLGLSNDELTDLNTRLNAQIAHQTRRMKVIADSQISSEVENESIHSTEVPANSEDSSTNLSSILKKRKASGETSPKKVRKVTFASPLIHELVFDSCSESRTIDAVTMNRIQNLNKKRKKILQEKNKTGKPSSVRPPVCNETEEIPSSSEYQDSDVVDFSDLPVSPALVNCPDDISCILKDLTSPSWIRGLESLLVSKDIKTIGDVCKLNIHQVKALPFKSPKVVTLHKALMSYLGATQEATLKKIKTIDDGSFLEMNDGVSSHSSESSKGDNEGENSEETNSVLLEETIKDILKKDSLKELPFNLLGQLVEACGKAILEKNQSS